MTQPPPPKKGPGAYGDSFYIRRIEGGYLLQVEHSEIVAPPETAPGDGSAAAQIVQIIPAQHREAMNRVQHTRQVVAKTMQEIVGHLREWTEGSTS